MKKILVTGSNGFIGRSIVETLNRYYSIVGVGRQAESISICEEYIKWDLGREGIPDTISSKNFDYIIHAAACKDKNDLSEELIYTNCVGSFNVVKAAKLCGAKGLIYISSLPIIGSTHGVPIDEKAYILPETMYHATKAAGELITSQARNAGIRVTSLRVPSPIGPGMPLHTIVPVFIQRAKSGVDIIIQGKGTRKQNYIDVRDLGEAIKKILGQDGVDGVFSVGSKNILSNIELAQLCIDALKSASKFRFSGKEDSSDEIDWTTDDSALRLIIGDYQNHSMVNSVIDIARHIG